MNIDWLSVLKAGGLAAAAAAVIGIFTAVPFIGPVIGLCYCVGGFLIPIAAGVGYGFLSPGEEDLGESALGGTLSGGTAGLLFGFLFGLSTLISTLISGGTFAEALAASSISSIFAVCGFAVAGLVFGAIGGILWPTIQARRA